MKKFLKSWGFLLGCLIIVCGLLWGMRGQFAQSLKEQDERDQHPERFIKIYEIKETPEGVRCFAPAFYGNPPDPKSGVTCVVVWEGRK